MFDLEQRGLHLADCVLQEGEDAQWPWRGEEAQAHGHGEHFEVSSLLLPFFPHFLIGCHSLIIAHRLYSHFSNISSSIKLSISIYTHYI